MSDFGENYIPAGMEDDLINPGDPNFDWDLGEFRGALLNVHDALDIDDIEYGGELDGFDDFLSDYEDEFGIDFYSDGEGDWQSEEAKVYANIQDAVHVLPQLLYRHDKARPLIRMLPYPVSETYESLFRVLEELELMVKVWKRRVHHPFTAHIQRKEEETATSVVDFSGTDIESDEQDFLVKGETLSQDGTVAKKHKVNESLTKKKYCQSARLFYNIFENDLEIDQLIGCVKKMRKYVQNLVFGMFMESFGADSLINRLPAELREKIWKLTQISSEKNKEIHHVGLRSPAHHLYAAVEEDRITELFGAVGNVHMIVFDILFSQPRMLKVPEFALVAGAIKYRVFPKRLFQRHLKAVHIQFHRLKALELFDFKHFNTGSASIGRRQPSNSSDHETDFDTTKSDGEVEPTPIMNAVYKLDRGIYEMQMNKSFRPNSDQSKFSKAKCRFDKSWRVAPLGADDHHNPFYVSIFGSEDSRRSAVMKVQVRDIKRDELVATINTDLELLNLFSSGKVSTLSSRISLYTNRFSIIHTPISTTSNGHHQLLQWILPVSPAKGAKKPLRLTKKDATIFDLDLVDAAAAATREADGKIEIDLEKHDMLRTTTIHRSQVVHVLVVGSSIVLIDAETGSVVDKVIYDTASKVSILSLDGNMMLLRHEANDPCFRFHSEKKLILLNLNTRCEVENYPFTTLCSARRGCCKDYDENDVVVTQCQYTAKFDIDRNEDSFIIYNADTSYFQIVDYKCLESGEVETHFRQSVLMDLFGVEKSLFCGGIFYACCSSPPDRPDRWDNNPILRFSALDLKSNTVFPIVSVTLEGLTPHQRSNDCHRRFFLKTRLSEIPGRSMILQFASDNLLVLGLGEDTYLTVTFHDNELDVLKGEAVALNKHKGRTNETWDEMEKRLKSNHAKQKQSDAERVALLLEVREKFLNKTGDEQRLRGKIHSWKSGRFYGFVRPVGEAEELGNLFLHASEVTDKEKRRRLRNHQWIEFHAKEDEGKSNHRAVNVTLVENPNRESPDDETLADEGTRDRRQSRASRGVAARGTNRRGYRRWGRVKGGKGRNSPPNREP